VQYGVGMRDGIRQSGKKIEADRNVFYGWHSNTLSRDLWA